MVVMGDPLLLGKVKGTLGHYEFYWVISSTQVPCSLWDISISYWDYLFKMNNINIKKRQDARRNVELAYGSR